MDSLIRFPVTAVWIREEDVTNWACSDSKPAEVTTSGTRIAPPVYDNGSYVLDQDCQWLIQANEGEVMCDLHLYRIYKSWCKQMWTYGY